MKTSLFLIALSLSSSAMAVDCLRFMGKVDQVLWTKTCNTIVADRSNQPVEKIDLCLGKFVDNGVTYLVVNSDVVKSQGYVKKDNIITKASYKQDVLETQELIKAQVSSASPELFTRYKHTLSFDKMAQELTVKKEKGTFSLTQQFDLTLLCE